jgi:hypothetical protein
LSLATSWVVFPLVLGLLSLGTGLLVAQIGGTPVQGVLLLPLGFAGIVVVALFTTSLDATARLTAPAVIALAVAGFALSWAERPRPDGWAAGAAVGAFLAVGAPVLASGAATFAGYITLDDTASWLGFTDRLLEHGRNLTGLPPSSFEAMLDYYWNQYGYPVGIFPPLGVGHVLLGTDAAWLFQPYIAFLAALLALGLYSVASGLVEPRPLRALAAFVAAQPALLYGYAQWGGVKELGTAAMLALTAALVPTALRDDARVRHVVPLAVAASAVVGILNVSAGAWLAPLFLPVVVLGIRRRGAAVAWLSAAFAGIVALLSIPTLALAGDFFGDVGLNGKGGDIGNLIRPLSWLQVAGIWPAGDFRIRPSNITATYLLIAAVVAAAVAAVVWSWRRGLVLLPLFVLATLVGCAIAVHVGSAWIAAKALAIASPAVLLAAMCGAAWLVASGRRVEGGVLAAFLVGGVLWSNVLAYHDVWLAPRAQLAELAAIGSRFAGDGPTLMTEYQPYGVRHFLYRLDPEGAGELRRRPVLLLNGQEVQKGGYADIDRFQLDGILVYRTLVLVNSPAASRPPSVYRLVWQGRYYTVWQRPEQPGTTILEHLPLGDELHPGAVPPCPEVLRLAALARANGGELAAVPRAPVTVVRLDTSRHPASWATYAGSPGVIYPSRSGTLETAVNVPAAGRFGFWILGSFRRRLQLFVDGRHVATAQQRLMHPGVATPLGSALLGRGTHGIALRYSSANLSPGSGGDPFALGPMLVGRTAVAQRVVYVAPADARTLCRRDLDWVEAVAGTGT